MSYRWVERVLDDDRVTVGGARLVLIAIAERADDAGQAYPGVADLAARTLLSDRQVQRHLRALEAAGRLAVVWGGGLQPGMSAGKRKGSPNRYRIVLAKGDTGDTVDALKGDTGDTVTPVDTVTPATPLAALTVTSKAPNGDTQGAKGCHPCHPNHQEPSRTVNKKGAAAPRSACEATRETAPPAEHGPTAEPARDGDAGPPTSAASPTRPDTLTGPARAAEADAVLFAGDAPARAKRGRRPADPDPWSAACRAMTGDALRTPAFERVWRDWAEHRRQIKKVLTPASIVRQVLLLESFGHAAALASIDASIRNGWSGLFAPRDDGRRNGARKAPPLPESRPFMIPEYGV